jgi:hypothetical protein
MAPTPRTPEQGGPADPAPPPDAPRETPRSVVNAILAAVVGWLAVMSALTWIASTGPGPGAGGWRLVLLKEVSVAAFVLALIAAVVAIVAIETRRRR